MERRLPPPPSPRPGLPALVRVHVQVELRAQVEVEKGVDAEDEEEDRHDDQEGILQDRAQFRLPFDPAFLALTNRWRFRGRLRAPLGGFCVI